MILKSLFLLLCALSFKETYAASNRTFPSDFKFGVATASYQVEGAWNKDGKGENIWDHIYHTNPDFIDNDDNGDIACDSYHKYKEDIALLKDLGVDYYRFSLSWSRILPRGVVGSPINQPGVDYYRNVLQELLDNEIEPMVTMYHWDLPQPLQYLGGWPNPELEDHYSYYARTVFEQFGDLVKYWMTFNEPKQTCQEAYGLGVMAPGIKLSGIADYKCAHTLVKAHAKAYHIYNEEFRAEQQVNSYTTNYAQDIDEADVNEISYKSDTKAEFSLDSDWEDSASEWLKVVPWGMRKVVNWISKTYNDPEIFITENGVSDTGGLDDDRRINFYREYLSNLLDAILDDGVNVTRYTAWSLMDNFEWARGYREKYGLYSVDFASPNRTRTPKSSAAYYTQVIATKCLMDACEE